MVAALTAKEFTATQTAEGLAEDVSFPYVGLVPFSESQAEFFFGRREESENVAANLRATRLTLLYGRSGVGKSSVLRAGVVAPLREIARHDLMERGAPDFAVIFFNSWSIDPVEGLSKCIREAVQTSLGQKTIDPLPPTRSLVEIIKTWTERYGIELLIILDQFEEYFLYHADESGAGTFAYEFSQAVNDSNLRVRFLLSMRDDTLSKLDHFKGSITTLFENRLQIDHLNFASAIEAIIEPVKKYNSLYATKRPFKFDHQEAGLKKEDLLKLTLEKLKKEDASKKEDTPAATAEELKASLVAEVLSQVQVGKVSFGVIGQGRVKKKGDARLTHTELPKASIEAPYLQLVMSRIWKDEDTIATRELKAATLNKLGGARKIVGQHLDKFMERLSEEHQDVAAAVFYYLVTPSGTKIAHTVETLAEYTKLSEERIKQLLDKLLTLREGEEKEEYRVLRLVNQQLGNTQIEAYEVYHDALAPAVLAWSVKHKSEWIKKQALAIERRKRRRIYFWAGVILSLITLTGVYFYTVQRNHLIKEEELKNAADIERNQARNKEEILISQQKSLKSNKDTLQSLVYLTNGSSEQKEDAIKILQQQIETKEIDSELTPLIKPILEKVAQSQPQTKAGQDAAATINQIAQQTQDTRLSPRVYIQIQKEEQRDLARSYQQILNTRQLSDIPGVRPRIIAPGIDNVGIRRNITDSELRYFHQTELERRIGEQLIQILNEAGLTNIKLKLIGGYESNPNLRPNHFELWLSADVGSDNSDEQ
jgi:hypothetical protein